MKKLLWLLLLVPYIAFSQVKVQSLPTTTVGALGDFLIKDKEAGGSGGTQKISILRFIKTYSIVTTSSVTPYASQWTTTNTAIFYNTGNVGIGVSTPTVTLHVGGNIGVAGSINTSTLYVNGSAITPVTTYSYSAGTNLGLSGNTFSVVASPSFINIVASGSLVAGSSNVTTLNTTNVVASNSITAVSFNATTSNVSSINTTSINATVSNVTTVRATNIISTASVVAGSLNVTTSNVTNVVASTSLTAASSNVTTANISALNVSSSVSLPNGVVTPTMLTANLTGTQILTDGATITWNISNGAIGSVTLTANRALSISNPVSGLTGTILVKQDATGSRTLSLPAGSVVVSGGAGAITLTTTANATDILTFIYVGTTFYWTYGKNYN